MSLQTVTPHRLTKSFNIAAARDFDLTLMFVSLPKKVLQTEKLHFAPTIASSISVNNASRTSISLELSAEGR